MRPRRVLLGFAPLLLFGCDYVAGLPESPDAGTASLALRSDAGIQLASIMDEINLSLAERGVNYRAAHVEYVTDGSGGEFGGTVLARNVGNKRVDADFVPGDPRREDWSGPVTFGVDDITYAIDRTGDATPPGGGLTAAQTDAAIVRAMSTWEDVRCSDLPLTRNDDFGVDIGIVAFLFGLGGSPFLVADVQHAGWRDINFAGNILGATLTLVFIDEDGNVTDVNNDGRIDVAFREIYYDPSWLWRDDGVRNVDVESVALHEAGHGLSQAHFGKVWIKNDGSLAASPRAVMNALYAAPFRALTGTDIGGHCGDWARWPRN